MKSIKQVILNLILTLNKKLKKISKIIKVHISKKMKSSKIKKLIRISLKMYIVSNTKLLTLKMIWIKKQKCNKMMITIL